MSTYREIEEVYKEDIMKKSKMINSGGETLGEIQGERRIWVDMEFVEKWRDYLFNRFPIRITGNAHGDWDDELTRMLKEAGVSIKK